MKTEEIIEGIIDMFIFESATDMPRWLEIGYGIVGWLCLIEVVYVIALNN